MKEHFHDLHLQNRIILIEALTYWAYDLDNVDDFDPNDPRRNRGAELAQTLLRGNDIRRGEFRELIDPEWAG